MDSSNTNYEVINSNTDEISIKELIMKIKEWWSFLLKKWIIISCAGVFGAIIGVAYSFLKKPIYKAELSFALEDEKLSGGGLGAAMGLASQFGLDLGGGGGGAFSGDNLLELMKSRSVVENTLLTTINVNGKNQTLAELYISFKKLRKNWEDKPEFKSVIYPPNSDRSKYTLQQDSILGVFYKSLIERDLEVDKVDKKLSIISVKVTSESELFAKAFTEVLVKNVSDFYINTKIKKSVQNVNILQSQTDSVRRELNAAISGVAASTDNNPNPNPLLQILRVPSQRRSIDVTANSAILNELVKNLELAKISLRKETPLIQIIDKPILPLEKDKVGKIKALVIGGILGAFLMVLYLVLIRGYKNIIEKGL